MAFTSGNTPEVVLDQCLLLFGERLRLFLKEVQHHDGVVGRIKGDTLGATPHRVRALEAHGIGVTLSAVAVRAASRGFHLLEADEVRIPG